MSLFLLSTVYSVKWWVTINKTALKMGRTRETFFTIGAFLIIINVSLFALYVQTEEIPKLFARAQKTLIT